MFLEIWMIMILVFIFGLCAWHSTKSGFKKGAMTILQSLVDDRIIVIHNDGSISPYSSFPKKKKRINNKSN